MAHQVETAFYAKVPAWHGLGTVVSEAKSSKEAIRLAKLDWTVIQEPVFLADGREIPGRKAMIRSSDRSYLSMVSDDYRYDNPAEAFDFTDALLDNGEVPVVYDAAGSLFKGRRIWLCAHLPERLVLGDRVGTHLVFATSYDKTLANTVVMTPNRVECNNMLTAAIKGARRKWSYTHTGNIAEKKKEAIQTLGLATKYMDGFEKLAEDFQQRKVSKQMLGDIIELVFPILPDDGPKTKVNAITQRNQFHDIFREAVDLKKFKGDAWGVYNAFGDFATHLTPVKKNPGHRERLFASFLGDNKIMTRAQDAIEKVTA